MSSCSSSPPSSDEDFTPSSSSTTPGSDSEPEVPQSPPASAPSTNDPHLQNVRTNCFSIAPSSGGSYPTVPNESLALEGAQHQHYHPANVRGISKKASGEASVAGAEELDDDDIDVANPQGGSGDDGMMPGLVDSFP